MTAEVHEIERHRCLLADAEGPVVRDADGARSLIQEAMTHRASVIVVPVSRLDPAFFQLRSGLAGEVLQKAANYGLKFAVVGDISVHVAASNALRDLVVESKRSSTFFFFPDMDGLTERLAAIPPRAD